MVDGATFLSLCPCIDDCKGGVWVILRGEIKNLVPWLPIVAVSKLKWGFWGFCLNVRKSLIFYLGGILRGVV